MVDHGANYRTAEEFEFVLTLTSSMIDRFTGRAF
jgi:hypothetical protein